MPKRKKGGQPGNTNAVKHGKYRAATRAARLEAARKAAERNCEWAAKCPVVDYQRVLDELRRLREAAKEISS